MLKLVAYNPHIKTVKRKRLIHLNNKMEIMKDYLNQFPGKPISEEERKRLTEKLWLVGDKPEETKPFSGTYSPPSNYDSKKIDE